MSSTPIDIRACVAEDIPAVLVLWSLARSSHAVTPDRNEDLERLVNELPGTLLVADSGGVIIGSLIAAWDGWRGNLYRLAVHPEHRRLGIGRQLVAAGEARLRGVGAHRVTALVGFGDSVAERFWDTAGYPIDPAIGRRVRNLAGTAPPRRR